MGDPGARSAPPTQRSRFGHGWHPYLAPYAGFLLLVELGRRLPPEAAGAVLALKVVVPLALLGYYARHGAYPELRGFRPGRGAVLDALVGLSVALLWMAPFVLGVLPGPGPEAAFDPGVHGEAARPLVLGLRATGFAGVTPFVEELFVRSFLLRLVDSYLQPGSKDFRDVPIGRFTRWSFAVTVLYFTFSHAFFWEYPVAFATCVIWNLWLYRRRQIGALVLSHAVANGAIFATVVLASGRLPDGRGGLLDLWYFL